MGLSRLVPLMVWIVLITQRSSLYPKRGITDFLFFLPMPKNFVWLACGRLFTSGETQQNILLFVFLSKNLVIANHMGWEIGT